MERWTERSDQSESDEARQSTASGLAHTLLRQLGGRWQWCGVPRALLAMLAVSAFLVAGLWTQQLPARADNGLTIHAPALAGTVGASFAAQFTASGGDGQDYQWTLISGSLPAGLSGQQIANTYVISGAPEVTGATVFTLRVARGEAHQDGQFSIVVQPPIAITTSSLASGSQGTPYQAVLAASGGVTPYTWALTAGGLPPGLTLSASNGSIDGTPLSGGSSFTVRVTDQVGATTTRQFSIAIAEAAAPLAMVTTVLPGAQLNVAYTWTVVTGQMPGLTLNSATGRITGTADVDDPTSFSVTIRVTDSDGTSVEDEFTIQVTAQAAGAPLAVVSTSLPSGTVGQAYVHLQPLEASGGTPPYQWSIVGSLPPGLGLSGAGVLSGTPTQADTFSFSVRVTDAAGGEATRPLSITIGSPPIVPSPGPGPGTTTSTLPPAALPEAGGLQVPVTAFEQVAIQPGQSAAVETVSESGATARVEAPAGALSGGSLVVAALADLDALIDDAPPPTGTSTVLVGFVFQVLDDDGEAVTGAFESPVTLTFVLPSDALPSDASLSEVALTYWNGEAWVEVDATAELLPDGTVQFTAQVTHFTIFALTHLPGRGAFNPAPHTSGLTLTQWGGGTTSILTDALAGGLRLWVFADGRAYGYQPSAPPVVNVSFMERFPNGLSAGHLVLIAR